MSAHCNDCGADMVYGHGEDWQVMTCPHCELRRTTYDKTPVDCLICELRDSFVPVLSKTAVLALADFEKRVAQFKAEVV